jgi:L-iditol 2-dehydrogenase
MKAAVLRGVRDLRIETAAAPEPGPGEVLIRIRACGVCPSDLRAYLGTRATALPRTPGHEWAGDVAALGAGVDSLTVGDRVAPDWRVVCGRCYYCRKGVFNYCANLGHIRGGFCEYGVAPATNVRVIPPEVSYEEACFSEPLACCINGSSATHITLGDDAVIVGCGPIGLKHLQLALRQGARVIASDPLPYRREMARELGAHTLIDPTAGDPVEQVKALTDGRGADVVIVAVGHPTAIDQGLKMAGINGRVNLFAGTYPPTEMPTDPNLVHYKQIVLTGSHDFTPHHFTMALKLIQYGIVRVAPLISHTYALDQIVDAFEQTASQRGLKSMVRIA